MENEENDISLFFDAPKLEGLTTYMRHCDAIAGNLCPPSACNVALIGVSDNPTKPSAADAIRRQLYPLRGDFGRLRVADLGNIKPGNGANNAFFGLQCVVERLTANGIVCIVMADDQRLTTALVEGLAHNRTDLSLSLLDARLDVGTSIDLPAQTTAQNYLLPLSFHNAIGYCNVLGYQQYYCSDSQLHHLEKHNAIDASLRLGLLRSHLFRAEPVLRDTDALSIDLCAIRQSDAPGATLPSPNGLMGEEACQLMRYAGTSDRLAVAGIFGLDCENDQRNQTAALAAQMLWHLLEGLDRRVGDYPAGSLEKCRRFFIPGQAEDELHFYYSPKLNRWWVEVPTKQGKRIMACQPDDYENAKNGQTPAVWFRHFMK